MVNPDLPPSCEGDPPIISEVPVIATTTEPFVPPHRRPNTPFRHLPGRLNQQLQQFTGFLTPLRASFAPLFSGSVRSPDVVPPFGRPQVVPQVSPEPVQRARIPSPTPHLSSNSSVDLSEADTSVDFS